jgi:hypothetical protein
MVQMQDIVNVRMNLQVPLKAGNFFDQLSNCQLLKKDCCMELVTIIREL